MRVLLCLCAFIAVSSAGIIGYHGSPFGYHGNYLISQPLPTFSTLSHPYGVTYTNLHGYPLPVAPSYFSYNLLPGNVVYTGIPGVVHYLPVAPPKGKGKPGKKPDDKKNGMGAKEDTTEEPKKEEETTSGGEAEDLSE